MSALLRRPMALLVIGFALLMMLLSSVAIVPETQQGIIIRFGKPTRIFNRYTAADRLGGVGAGLEFKLPFIDNIVWIDKRLLDVDMERQQVLSTDQLRLEVDAFARFRITNPLRAYIAAGTEQGVGEALRPILGSELRNELGKRSFGSLLSPERAGAMENIRRGLNRYARQYGAEIVDVRIKKADLPDGTPLQSAYESMRTARQQEARSIRAQGAKQAQIIKAQADADASKIYAASFGKDPAFYDFYRSMISYRYTFLGEGSGVKPGRTNVILSPQNDYLKQFSGR